MNTAAQRTRAEVERLAKDVYGREYVLRENRNAQTREQRLANCARSKAIRTAIDGIRQEIKEMGDVAADLANAARFVVDVDGDHPSIGQLAVALRAWERKLAIQTEANALAAEQKTLDTHSHRWDCGRFNSTFGWFSVEQQADTLDEMYEKLSAVAKNRGVF